MTRAAIFPGTPYRRITLAADVARGTNVIRLAPEVFLPALLLHGLHTTPLRQKMVIDEPAAPECASQDALLFGSRVAPEHPANLHGYILPRIRVKRKKGGKAPLLPMPEGRGL